jgi:hypothetical protein
MRRGGDSGNEGDGSGDRRSEDSGGSGRVDGDNGAAGRRYMIDGQRDEGQREGTDLRGPVVVLSSTRLEARGGHKGDARTGRRHMGRVRGGSERGRSGGRGRSAWRRYDRA